MIRKLTLEQRIARLEKLIKNEVHPKLATLKPNEGATMEMTHDVRGARATGRYYAGQFTKETGIALTPDNTHPIVYSDALGWTDESDLDEDPESLFVLKYDAIDDPNISVYFCPTKGKVCVWSSLGTGSKGEGAVNPKTGDIEWEDSLMDAMYPFKAWRGFDLASIHGDDEDNEYDESCKRRRNCRMR